MIANQPVTKEEYLRFVNDLALHSRSAITAAKQRFAEEVRRSGHMTNTLINSEGSTGQFLTNTENVFDSYYVLDAKDCGIMLLSKGCSQFWRGIAEGAELGYQSAAYFQAYCTYNCYQVYGGSFNLYSLFLYNSCSHCFGCAGLNKKSYCILNRQYSKEEYYALVPQIVAHMKQTGEWGHYFPAVSAPHFFEDSLANDWIAPLSRAQIIARGYRAGPAHAVDVGKTQSIAEIPDSIIDLTPEIANATFTCEATGKQFRFQAPEIEFYKRHLIPLPNRHWHERIKTRIAGVFLIPAP